jgi:hypothetical protein
MTTQETEVAEVIVCKFHLNEEVLQMGLGEPVQILVVSKILPDRVVTKPSIKHIDRYGEYPKSDHTEEWAFSGQIYWRWKSSSTSTHEDWAAYITNVGPNSVENLKAAGLRYKLRRELEKFSDWNFSTVERVATTLGITLPQPKI